MGGSVECQSLGRTALDQPISPSVHAWTCGVAGWIMSDQQSIKKDEHALTHAKPTRLEPQR